jgi:transcriptional regulator with XRE-family HTH domain
MGKYGSFATMFKRLRKANGYTQEALAKAMHISRSTVGMYESGQREPNNLETLEMIADFFNVDTDYLMGRTNKITMIPEPGYYTNPETAAAAQEMMQNDELNALYHVQRTMSKEHLKAMYSVAKALKDEEMKNNDDTGC